MSGHLRFVTWLVPSLPAELYETVARAVATRLGCEWTLSVDSRSSGPRCLEEDVFGQDRADVGFLCAPAYLWLRDRRSPSVERVPVGPVHDDSRNDGRPVYFSEFVVRRDSPYRSFGDLRGRHWVYNDPSSLSGFFNVIKRLAELNESEDFFASASPTGGHRQSLAAILDGTADGAAIDSNALPALMAEQPELADSLRVLESWGPFPAQPVVVRRGHGVTPDELAEVLLELHEDPELAAAFARCRFRRFAPAPEQHYDQEAEALARAESLASAVLERAAATSLSGVDESR